MLCSICNTMFCNTKPSTCYKFALADAVMATLFLFGSELLMPGVIQSTLKDAGTINTQAKFEAALGLERTRTRTVTFFNLTNAHDLQTVNPPPKPIFDAIDVAFTTKVQSFGFELSADGATYSYKTWQYDEAVTASDLSLEIIQVNSMLPKLVREFGGEATMKATHDAAYAAGYAIDSTLATQALYMAGCQAIVSPPNLALIEGCVAVSLTYAALMWEKMNPLNLDGTGITNLGLFTKRTVNELMNGYVDPLLQAQYPGMLLGFNGYPDRASLEAALAAGTEAPAKWTSSQKVNQGDAFDAGAWHELRGYSNVTLANLDTSLPWWTPRSLGYNNEGAGAMTGAAGPFVIDGLRTILQPVQGTETVPSVFKAGYPPKVTPRGGETLTVFDENALFREVTYSCGDCQQDTLHGFLNTMTYSMDQSNGYLYQNGVVDQLGACALTQTCDFASPMPDAWATPSGVFTLPYFGGLIPSPYTSATVTIKDKASGVERAYDAQTMKNELTIEPFSGSTTKFATNLQLNEAGVDAANFNGNLYSNVFARPVAFPAIWPVAVISVEFVESEANAQKQFGAIGTSYMLMIIGDVSALLFLLGCAYQLMRARHLTSTRTAPGAPAKKPTKDVSDDVSKVAMTA